MEFANEPNNQQGVAIEAPQITTDLSNEELNQIINSRIAKSKQVYSELKIDQRRKINEEMWQSQHVKQGEVEGLPYINPVIFRNTEQRISLAAGRLPDLIVSPGDGSLNARQNAKKIERALDTDLLHRGMKRLLKNGLRHNHIYFIGVAKAVWNPQKTQFGDYEFNLVDPKRLLISHDATIPEDGYTIDNANMVVEIVEKPVATVLAMFPEKRAELMQLLRTSDGNKERMATSIRYQEIWYTYNAPNGQIIEGTCWRYQNLILRNMKNPYFDWDGYERPLYDQAGSMRRTFDGSIASERIFRNHFERPRKPYILFSYQNLGKTPLDDTTAIEQSRWLQQNLNKTGKQIRDISDGITNKYAFNRKMDKAQAREVSANPKQAIWIDSDDKVGDVVMSFRNDGPPPALFNELAQTRAEIDSVFQTHGTTRGETISAESGISKQISREGDLVTSDDIVDVVIERVVEEMAGWALQFMKLMYVDTHFKSKMGKDGELIQEMIQRDMIDDGISVTVRSSVADKNTAKREAMTQAEAGIIDPLSFMEDLDVENPKERTQRLLAFKKGEGEGGDGFASYLELVGLNQQGQPGQPEQQQGAPLEGDPNQQMPPEQQQAPQPGQQAQPQPQPAAPQGQMAGLLGAL